jgi:hypothetical protein
VGGAPSACAMHAGTIAPFSSPTNDMDLDQLIAQASNWVQQERNLRDAALRPLSGEEIETARAVGVARPDMVRVGLVSELPVPSHPGLASMASSMGIFSPSMSALALGYMVLIRERNFSASLLKHELRLVHHFEIAGSVGEYLRRYIAEVMQHGYGRTPMERDAERLAAA